MSSPFVSRVWLHQQRKLLHIIRPLGSVDNEPMNSIQSTPKTVDTLSSQSALIYLVYPSPKFHGPVIDILAISSYFIQRRMDFLTIEWPLVTHSLQPFLFPNFNDRFLGSMVFHSTPEQSKTTSSQGFQVFTFQLNYIVHRESLSVPRPEITQAGL